VSNILELVVDEELGSHHDEELGSHHDEELGIIMMNPNVRRNP
jgi:hypothetical protein